MSSKLNKEFLAASVGDLTIKEHLMDSHVTSVSMNTDTPPGLVKQQATAQHPVSDRPVFCSGANLSEPPSLTYLTAASPTHPL